MTLAYRPSPMGAGGRTATHWWESRAFVVAATFLAVVPLVWPAVPPLVDLLGHMGRYRVQLAIGSNPWLNDWYAFKWQLIGNLGVDLLVIPMAKIFGLELGVKLIVMTIPALIVAGLLWIAREVHGRIPPTALFALPLAYCYPLQFGFVNFALSMGLAFVMFGLWLRLARLGRLKVRAVVFVPLSCILWVCHTFGWGVLGVLAFSAEMIRQHDLRKDGRGGHWLESWVRAGLGCLPLALPMLFMVLWRSGDHVTGQTADWFDWRFKIQWITMILRDRWLAFDIASTAVLLLVLMKGLRDPGIEYSRHLGLSTLFLVAVYILLPRIVFGSAYADMRLAPFMIAIALIAIRPKPGLSMRGAAVLAAMGLAFFLVRIGAQTVSYWMFDQTYKREFAAIDKLPPRARLLTFIGYSCRNTWTMSRLEHAPGLAMVRKMAFANDQWSMPGGQLLTTHYAAAGKFAHDPSQIVTQYRCPRQWWRPIGLAMFKFPRDAYDYLWLIDPPRYDRRLTAGLTPIWRSGRSVLFKVDHGAPGPVYDPATMKAPLY